MCSILQTSLLKSYVFPFLIALTIVGCVEDPSDSYSITFLPRKIDSVKGTYFYLSKTEYKGRTYTESFLLNDSVVKASDFLISISTGVTEMRLAYLNNPNVNLDDPKYLSEHIISLENEIKTSYRQASNSSSRIASHISSTAFNIVKIYYNTNSVQSLKISALDNEILEKKQNESLNDELEIIEYYPNFIASADTKSLLYGYSDTDKPTSIDELINLKPLIPVFIRIHFRNIPTNLPLKTRFKIDMVNEDGKLVSDTTKAITLIN